jgi:hypothetical protein
VEDQRSIFVAAFSHSLSVKALQRLPEFQTATHRIAAWRKRSRQRSLTPETKVLYDLGYDDDGEKWAGNRLQHVLEDMKVEGVVVVARWYGGQNIGPVRFTHIENTAKEAIWKWKVADAAITHQQAAKRQKVERETRRNQLEENLRERDLNIFVLRGLLADKKARLNGTEPAPPTPQKGLPDYSKMTMEALQRVDRARDATIAFILKQIDKVDEQLALADALNASSSHPSKEADQQQGKTEKMPVMEKQSASQNAQ